MATQTSPLPPPPPTEWTPPGVGQQGKGKGSSGKKKIGTQLPELVFPQNEEERSKAKVFRFLKPPSPSSPLPSPPPRMMSPSQAVLPDGGCGKYPLPPLPSRSPNPSPISPQVPLSAGSLSPYPPPSSTPYPSPTWPRFPSPPGTPPPPLSPTPYPSQTPSKFSSTAGWPSPPPPPRPALPSSPRSTPPERPPQLRVEESQQAPTQPAAASPQREERRDDAAGPLGASTIQPPSKDPYIGSKNVVNLNGDNFHTFVNNKALAMVMFYHPLDDKSAVSKGHFKKAADAKKHEQQFAAVNCQQESQFCESQNVTMAPVFKLFSWGTAVGTIRDTSKFDHRAIIKYIDTLASLGEPQKHTKTANVQAPPESQEPKCSLAKRLGFKK